MALETVGQKRPAQHPFLALHPAVFEGVPARFRGLQLDVWGVSGDVTEVDDLLL